MACFIYILASKRNVTLYIGHTNDLARRIFEHRAGAIDGFTKTYKVNRLVHYEVYEDIRVAQQRERKPEAMGPAMEAGSYRTKQPRLA